MKQFFVTAAAGFALTAAVLVPSGVAHAGVNDAVSVAQAAAGLHSRGYTVIVNNASNAPLDQCTNYSIRPGHTFTRMDSGFPGAGDDLITKVVSMTVYIDASC